jgi:hypothetical protein
MVTIKPRQPLFSLSGQQLVDALQHPAQQTMLSTITQLIIRLRDCETPEHYYNFQRSLFSCLYEAQERHQACSRIVKRLSKGDRLPANAPQPPPTGDPLLLETWELELYVYQRLIRQLRTVGDGLAWTCFGYDRRPIFTLSRNNSPGLSHGKLGLHAELAAIDGIWQNEGLFALHHDSTNCLRISDLTKFGADGQRVFGEVKTSKRKERKQQERTQAAVDALNHGGPLPGSDRTTKLITLHEPYVTNLKQLNDLLQLAKTNGCHGTNLTQGRALVAASIPALSTRWDGGPERVKDALDATRQQALQRAVISNAPRLIVGQSGDRAARSPLMAPWSIYPFSPVDCALLICDLLMFDTYVSADALIESLGRVGLRGEVLLTTANRTLEGTMPVLRVHWRNRAVIWNALGLHQLLLELVEPDTLARGLREAILMGNIPAHPSLVYANEAASWFAFTGVERLRSGIMPAVSGEPA